MGFPAAEFGQQLHFDPFEGDAQIKEQASGDLLPFERV